MIHKKCLAANKEGWNIRTPIHYTSKFYDVLSFKVEGVLSLKLPELQLLPNIVQKKLLHLQCHFGLDSLSWARLGAEVTGVDFSEVSINSAKRLSKETNVSAVFLCEDVQKLDKIEPEGFDIVFTSYGVLPWIEDLSLWAESIYRNLKIGGKVVLVEYHPCVDLLHKGQISGLDTYFDQKKPSFEKAYGTYTNKDAPINFIRYTWQHSVSDVMMSLINVGLALQEFQEYPYCSYQLFPELKIEKNGVWYPDKEESRIPYMYSLVMNR